MESKENEKNTDIFVFGRNERGEKQVKKITNFFPYFYVSEDSTVPSDYRITKIEKGHKSILGEPLKKIYCRKQGDIGQLRERFTKHYEADIPVTQRYIVDEVGEIDPYKLKTLYLDIELNTKVDFPDMLDPDQEVVCISFIDDFTNKPYTILYKPKDHDIIPKPTPNLRIVNSEEALLAATINYIKDSDPDIISGWNCLDKDTHIHTLNGLKTLDNISVGDILENGDSVLKKAHSKKRVVEFGSNFGIIRTSKDHKFLVVDTPYKYKSLLALKKEKGEFKKVENVKKGFLKLEYDTNKNKDTDISDFDLYLLGIIYSDGTIGRNRISVYNNNIDIINRIYKNREENDASVITTDKRHTNTTFRITVKRKNIKNLDIVYNGYKKELNIEKLSTLSPRQFAVFCSGLIDGDGSYSMIQVNQETSYKETNGFHNLLISNGIIGSRHKTTGQYSNRFHIISVENDDVLSALENNVINSYKIKKIKKSTKLNRSTKIPKYFIDRKEKTIYTYITTNNITDDYADMVDIETTSHTFKTPFITHNCDHFDLVYLIRRMGKLGIEYGEMSPMWGVYIDEKFEDVTIKGRVVLDMMKAYMYFRGISNQGRAESYSLEFTAQDVLGRGKIEHLESFYDMWVNYPDKLVEYNVRDVVLVNEINRELEIIDFFNSIRSKACTQLKNIYQTTALIDGLLLNRTKGKMVLPSKNFVGGDKYTGAYVFEPKPGVYNNILALDVKGMYPNIIKTFNMGYETFNKEGSIKITKDIAFDDGIGLISETIRDLQEERAHYKSIMKKTKDKREWKVAHFRQYAVKVLMNSIYGYLGFPKARLYKKEVAFAVTHMGQKLIKWTQKFLIDKGYDIVYGDTDSVYVQSKKNTKVSMLIEGNKLVQEINESYKEFSSSYGAKDCTLEMEFEKVFKSIIFVEKRGGNGGAKKKYAYIPLWIDGKDVDGSVEYTGFDTVRSDIPRIAREVQKNVIEMILNGGRRQDIENYIVSIDKKIKAKEIPDEEIGFPKGLSSHLEEYKQANPAVTGALYSNKYLGTRFTKGSKPKWIYVRSVPTGYPPTHVIAYDEFIPEGFTVDYKTLNDKIFKMKLESIFKAAGFGEFPDVDSNNSKLSAWGL